MEAKVRRGIGLVAHDAMKKDLIEWVLWNSELLMGNKFYCTGTTGTLILEALKEKHPDVEWDFTILKSGPLGGDQQMGSRIVDGQIDYLFFFTDPMTLQPHDTDVKALTRLAGVENIVFCCNRSTADHIISSPLFMDPDYERIPGDLEQLTEDCKAYIAQNQLTKAPNYFKLWMSGEKDDEVVAINDKLEALVEEMSNTKSASLIGLLNNYPMIPVSAHVRPFHIYWLNLAAGVIFPIGLFFYFRIWAFRIRLAKDMERIIKNNEQVQFIIQKINK